MSMFKRMLASAGIGAAQVDLLLHEDEVNAGDTMTGVVRIQGGRVNQQVDDVYAFAMTSYEKSNNDRRTTENAAIAKFLLAGKFTVEAEKTYEFPVSFRLPTITPMTTARTPVWIQTGLEIQEAINPKDRDELQVGPHPHSAVVLEAVRQLGFRLREVTCDYAPHIGRKAGVPFVQEFEFVPTSLFQGQLDELEVVFFPDENGIDVHLQVDRKARGLSGLFAEALNADERIVKVRFERGQLSQGSGYIADQLGDLVRRSL
ncbi:sporulation protein [Cohnella suwonensis]|uniref:Sporulation protein n=1 Tax=Cohnella suwonensis TaxID=696072 RepID=A0ABW0LTE2_9BACL